MNKSYDKDTNFHSYYNSSRANLKNVYYCTYTGLFDIITGISTAYNFQTENNKMNLLIEYERVTQRVLLSVE
jgi:hypothetical protein